MRCGYERKDGDQGPDYACPKCGAVYAKVEAAAKSKSPRRPNRTTKTASGNPILGLFAAVFVIFVTVHAIMLFRYGAATPCEAAARRLAIEAHEKQFDGTVTAAEVLATRFVLKNLTLPVTRLRMSLETTSTCYKVALGFKSIDS